MAGFRVVLLLYAALTIPSKADGAVSLSSLGLPLPDVPTGYVYKNGNPLAPIQIEMFGDLVCPAFKASFPVMKEVADWYGPNLMCLKIHLFPLPYHKYAFLTHQVLHIVEPYIGINGTFDYMDRILANNEKFGREVLNRTEGQIHNELLRIVQTFGVPAVKYWEGVNSFPTWNKARIEFKYACHRGVASSPAFFVNGVMVLPAVTAEDGTMEGFSLAEWKEALDPMLGTPEQRQQKEQTAADGFSYGTCPTKPGGVTCSPVTNHARSETAASSVSTAVLVLLAVITLFGTHL